MAKNKTANGHIKSRSRTMSILAQYFSNKMAVFCAGVIVVLVLMAILCQYSQNTAIQMWIIRLCMPRPVRSIGLAVIQQAVIC